MFSIWKRCLNNQNRMLEMLIDRFDKRISGGGITMDIREKLVELIAETIELYPSEREELADGLIANGVMVQEWILAEEPPEEYRDKYGELIPFLVCEEGTDYPFRAFYDGKNWGDGIFAISVKWWMRLPAPPKEKERKNGDGNV